MGKLALFLTGCMGLACLIMSVCKLWSWVHVDTRFNAITRCALSIVERDRTVSAFGNEMRLIFRSRGTSSCGRDDACDM